MTCIVDGCDRGIAARSLCSSHYTRWRRHGDPGPAQFNTKKPLTTDELIAEMCWQLDGGESTWMAARSVGMKPDTILKRIAQADDAVPGRDRVLKALRAIVAEARRVAA